MPTNRALEVVEIVRTFDVGPIQMPAEIGDDFRFRIEILRVPGHKRRYRARVWRIEMYRIQPTFPQRKKRLLEPPCDEILLVRDDFFSEGSDSSTPEATLKKAVRRIRERFGTS